MEILGFYLDSETIDLLSHDFLSTSRDVVQRSKIDLCTTKGAASEDVSASVRDLAGGAARRTCGGSPWEEENSTGQHRMFFQYLLLHVCSNLFRVRVLQERWICTIVCFPAHAKEHPVPLRGTPGFLWA